MFDQRTRAHRNGPDPAPARRRKRPGFGSLGVLAAALAVGVAPLTVALAGSAPAGAAPVPFLARFAGVSEVASTVPANGDVNPYGVATVPFSTGALVRGDTLVSNFNAISNLQGTGTTIVEVAPTGQVSLFAEIDPNLPGCPGGVGLTTALGVLNDGYVVVGSLPVTMAGAAPPRPGASSCSTARACRSRRGPGTASTGPGT